MGPLLLALSLGDPPDLWVATEGFDSPACDSSSLVSALRAQQPAAAVHPWQTVERPPAGGVLVRLASKNGVTVLEITGAGEPIRRTLPPVDDCKRDVDLAALIVDGALDDLRVSGSAPRVDSLAPPVPFRSLVEAGVALGAGAEQAPSGWVASVDVQGFARYRFYELTLDVDLGVPSSASFTTGAPEIQSSGRTSMTSLAVALGFGVAPRLGPGRASLNALLGGAILLASATDSPPTALFHPASQTLANAFVGLRLGYSVTLPLGLFVGARVEERLAPTDAGFGVVGANPTLTTRNWTFQTAGFVGYRFL